MCFIDVLLANDVRDLLINILCMALYGCCWLMFLYLFLQVLFGCENKSFSKELIENIQCI